MHPFFLAINRAAQTPNALESICRWFENLASADRCMALDFLSGACQQAHPLANEGTEAIVMSGMKPTFTPCVMLSKVQFPERAVHCIAALPADEQIKSFRLLFCLFAIADQRRREQMCRGSCSHDWHNLSPI